MNHYEHQFVIPGNQRPSFLRRIFRRTLYLRLLDGEFLLWCFETDQATQHSSDFLRQQRVVVSDTEVFAKELQKAMNEIGVGSVPFCKRFLVLHSLRFHASELAETEKYALYEMWRKFGRDFYVISTELTNSAIVEICSEVGALIPSLKRC